VLDQPDPPGQDLEQRELLARLRAVVEAKDAENGLLRAELAAERELRKRLELQVAELQSRRAGAITAILGFFTGLRRRPPPEEACRRTVLGIRSGRMLACAPMSLYCVASMSADATRSR
jgi:hypothetical protein